MRTRSNFYPFNSTATIPICSNRRRVPNIVELEIRTIEEIVPIADRTMEELLQAPTKGDVPNDAMKLMRFPYSLEGAARVWYKKEPPNSILTWDYLVNKFVNQFFPPSKTTHLKNEISCFTQRFEETFKEAWGCFKEMLRACTHHGFLELTQIDTFYNGLTKQDHDSLNAVAGGNPLNKTTREALKIIESKSKNQPSTLGTLSSNTVPNLKGEMKAVTTRSGLAYEGQSIPTNYPLKKVDEQNTKEILDKEHSNCPGSTAQVQPLVVPISILKPNVSRTQPKPTIPYPSSFADALLLMPKFASTIKILLANKDKLFELAKVLLIENCRICFLKSFQKILEIWKKLSLPELTPTRMTLKLADRSITRPKGVVKDVFVKVGKFHFPTNFVVVDFEANPRVPLILGRLFLRTRHALIDVYGEEITLRYNPKSSNPNLVSDSLVFVSDLSKVPIVKSSSPTLTPFGESDFFLEEIGDFLNDDSIPTGFENSVYDPEGDIIFLEKLLNEDPFQPPLMDLKLAEESKAKSFVEEPTELELKELSSQLEYVFLEESNKLLVIIAKNLKDVEKEALINVLKSHKRAIAWKISDIKGYFQVPIDPQDQEKTTFTCPYGTFVYRRMPFGLCNAPEGIVLGHKILKSGIEVNRAKVDVIAKLPHPTTVKGVRSFLGHAEGRNVAALDVMVSEIGHVSFNNGHNAWSWKILVNDSFSVQATRSHINNCLLLRYLLVQDCLSLFLTRLKKTQKRTKSDQNQTKKGSQYLQHEYYTLWEVIEFGDSYKVPTNTDPNDTSRRKDDEQSRRTVTITTRDMQRKKNNVKARTTLLLSLPDEHQLRFSKYKTVKELWAVILKTFGGNEATKKRKKNLLKQQYGNIKVEGSETLEQTFNRLQVIMMHTIVWRNKNDLDNMSLDDLYNHLKVYEAEVQTKSNSHNMAFISSSKNNSGNEDSNIPCVSTTSTTFPTGSVNVATICQDTASAYIASQSNGSQIKFEDINQIDKDDMEKIDIKWSMALLSMRENKFWKRTGKKISIQGSDVAGEDHALVANGVTPTKFALMANTESNVFDNSFCSNDCKKNTDNLNSKIKDLKDELSKANNYIYHYELVVAQLEGRLTEYKKGEVKYIEKISTLVMYRASNLKSIKAIDKELEEVKLEKDGLDGKLARLLKALKNLDHLIVSQRSDQVKKGVGYNVVPPPAADLYLSPKKDLSWTGLPEFVDDTVTDYSRPSPTIESTSAEGQIKDSSTSKDVASPNPPKPFVKFVKPKVEEIFPLQLGNFRLLAENLPLVAQKITLLIWEEREKL
nr:hypothetical protein [Tanacetum cinerariifolium]